MQLDLSQIQRAQEALAPYLAPTPLVYSQTFSRLYGGRVYLKLENLQTTGSFKLRGSLYKLLQLQAAGQLRGVVAASAGNHAQGVAYAASLLGVPATIVMPVWASLSKQAATQGYGGRVLIRGRDLAEAVASAQELAVTAKLQFIHPYDDPAIMAGQGTIGLEILTGLPETAAILVPVGGGGLAAGIAVACKSLQPRVKIIGVQTRAVPGARAALEAGYPVAVPPAPTLADGIKVTRLGDQTFPLLARYLDDLRLVAETDIATAMLLLLEKKKVLAEGAGAVPLAALLASGSRAVFGEPVVLVISGGNIDIPLVERVLQRGLLARRRLLRFTVILEDTPGALGRLASQLGTLQANIFHIQHDRLSLDLPLNQTRVELHLETLGPDHCRQIMTALQEAGYQVVMEEQL